MLTKLAGVTSRHHFNSLKDCARLQAATEDSTVTRGLTAKGCVSTLLEIGKHKPARIRVKWKFNVL